jgi:hypothetical protein
MKKTKKTQTVLGLDIGRVNTRAGLLGVQQGAYGLLGSGQAVTSLGKDSHVGSGVQTASTLLQKESGRRLLDSKGDLIFSTSGQSLAIDQLGLSVSAGPRLRTALLGLTSGGSLKAAQQLADSMPLTVCGRFGLEDLVHLPALVDRLVRLRSDLILITGGENDGAVAPVLQLIEAARLACLLLPRSLRPEILFAGNPSLHGQVQRRLDPVISSVRISANLQPDMDQTELLLAQVILDDLILRHWQKRIEGLKDLRHLADPCRGTMGFGLGRMIRFLSQAYAGEAVDAQLRGVMAVDLGAESTVLAAAFANDLRLIHQPTWDLSEGLTAAEALNWNPVQVGIRTARMYINNHKLRPALIPSDVVELALSQSLARLRLRKAVSKLNVHYPDFGASMIQGLPAFYEPIIASGSVLTAAPTPGQSMLILLDGLQPCGVTTIVLDRHHILSVLGVLAPSLPILPVQVLDSQAFTNLGTVISPVSSAKDRKTMMVVKVLTESQGAYTAEIIQGTIRRLPLPVGETAKMLLTPTHDTDIGFGGPGVGGQLVVRGGVLGIVVDARGRPLCLAEDEESRFEQIRQWLWALGG